MRLTLVIILLAHIGRLYIAYNLSPWSQTAARCFFVCSFFGLVVPTCSSYRRQWTGSDQTRSEDSDRSIGSANAHNKAMERQTPLEVVDVSVHRQVVCVGVQRCRAVVLP